MDALLQPYVRSRRWVYLVLTALLPEIGLLAEPAANLPSATPSPATMKAFVIIFRQGPRLLTDTEKQRRAEETSVWARNQNDAGHKLDPHILAPESACRGAEKSVATASDVWPITALLFLEAHDLSEAARVAESHPALRYGANVEVRPWAPPVPNASAAKASVRP
jgi:hypothetical protein